MAEMSATGHDRGRSPCDRGAGSVVLAFLEEFEDAFVEVFGGVGIGGGDGLPFGQDGLGFASRFEENDGLGVQEVMRGFWGGGFGGGNGLLSESEIAFAVAEVAGDTDGKLAEQFGVLSGIDEELPGFVGGAFVAIAGEFLIIAQRGGELSGFLNGGEVVFSSDDSGENFGKAVHWVAVPEYFTGFGDDKSVGDASLAKGIHVSGTGGAGVVASNGVLHLVPHLFDKGFYGFGGFVGDADEGDTMLFEFVLELREMGDGCAAGATPGGPELDDVDGFPVLDVGGLAFDPRLDSEGWGGVAELGSRQGGSEKAEGSENGAGTGECHKRCGANVLEAGADCKGGMSGAGTKEAARGPSDFGQVGGRVAWGG